MDNITHCVADLNVQFNNMFMNEAFQGMEALC
jgi:hypothetical protein